MPCHDSRSVDELEGYRRGISMRQVVEERAQLRSIKQRLDVTTRLACDFCTLLEERGHSIPPFALDWWKDHKAQDEKRKTKCGANAWDTKSA